MRLKKVTPYASAGFGRSSGRSPHYVRGDGGAISAADVARAEALVIPPAWTEVWISRHANGHIQAVGLDAAARRQYLYHAQWRVRQDQVKFERARQLASVLPKARAQVTRDLHLQGIPRERVLAAAFRILDTMAVRVGNAQYTKANGSHGLATLQRRHARVAGAQVTLAFPAKSGKKASVQAHDEDLARVVRLLGEGGPRAILLAWGDERHPLTAADINAYVKKRTGTDFTAKDFRTLKGTIAAAQFLAELETPGSKTAWKAGVRAASRATALVLGNTPAVALKSYIDPEVIERYKLGEVIGRRSSPERELLQLLGRPSPVVGRGV